MANIMAIIAMFAKENPEAAKELMDKLSEVVKDFGTKAFEAETETKKNRHEIEKSITDALAKELQNTDLTFEERMKWLDMVMKYQDKVNAEIEKDRQYELKILEFAAGTLFGGPVFLVGYAGVKAYQNHNNEPKKISKRSA